MTVPGHAGQLVIGVQKSVSGSLFRDTGGDQARPPTRRRCRGDVDRAGSHYSQAARSTRRSSLHRHQF